MTTEQLIDILKGYPEFSVLTKQYVRPEVGSRCEYEESPLEVGDIRVEMEEKTLVIRA